MIDFTEIPYTDDTWELFARDFLLALDFFVESPPDRGPDAGKDMLVTEEVKGRLHTHRFRWLVSCKHFAHSGTAVNENDHERNILERVRGFDADGFLGFYSTLASAGLNRRLTQLKREGEIKDYRIFDRRLIENYMLGLGFSRIMMRFLPQSYRQIRPLHRVIDEYVPLQCDHCGRDILKALFDPEYTGGLVAQVTRMEEDGSYNILTTYFACKGECDKMLDRRCWEQYHCVTRWHSISDLAMPNELLRSIMATINQLHDPHWTYSNEAVEKEKRLIIALSQKVFREVSEEDRARMRDLMTFMFLSRTR